MEDSSDDVADPTDHECARCGSSTQLVRITPGLGQLLPELRTYKCPRCGQVETHEAN